MESVAAPLRALHEKAARFVVTPAVRLLAVGVAGDLRSAALTLLTALELRADNHSAWLLLEDPTTPASPGWDERSQRLRALHAERVEAFAKDGETLPSLPPPPTAATPLAGFVAQLLQCVDARAAWQQAPVVVLAPTAVHDAIAWEQAVQALVVLPALREVRWVSVEMGTATLGGLLWHLGAHALSVNVAVDEAAARKELGAMLDAMAAASPDSPGPARAGASWPRGVVPPPRPRQPSAVDVEGVLAAAGLAQPLAGSSGGRLAMLVLRAAQAMREQRPADAIELQRHAVEHCQTTGARREALTMAMVLGAYLAQAQQNPSALETYRVTQDAAVAQQALDLAAQAGLAMGTLWLLQRDPSQAAVAFTRAGRLARDGGATVLAIEAFRMAGQVLAEARREADAVSVWREALAVAEAGEPGEVAASSASETALAMADMYRRRGQHDLAATLTAQAERLREPPPKPLETSGAAEMVRGTNDSPDAVGLRG